MSNDKDEGGGAIKNVWRKMGYKWFPKEVDEIEAAEGYKEIAAMIDECLEEELPNYIALLEITLSRILIVYFIH